MQTLVILGAGGHARVILDIVTRAGLAREVGFVAQADSAERAAAAGFNVFGTEDQLAALDVDAAIIGIGDNWTRARVAERARGLRPDVKFVTAVHPSAVIASTARIGDGTVVMAGAIVNPGAQIGRHCIVNTGAVVDHDVVLEDFVSVGPRAALGGMVHVGAYTAIGIGAVASHGVVIGAHAVVGAGAAVVRDIPERVVCYGVPCRVARVRVPGEKYL